jgi:hypothetical protein
MSEMRMFTLYVVEQETGERIAIRPGLVFEEANEAAGIPNRFTIKSLDTGRREVLLDAHAFKTELTESWDNFIKLVTDGTLRLVNSPNVIREMREIREREQADSTAKEFEKALEKL